MAIVSLHVTTGRGTHGGACPRDCQLRPCAHADRAQAHETWPWSRSRGHGRM